MIKIKSNAAYVYRVSGNNFMPGVNFVKDDAFLKHPAVQSRIKLGLLEVLESDLDNVRTEEIEGGYEFSGLNAKTLIAEIKEIYNHATLSSIIERDERVSVIDAAKKQLGKIKEEEESN